MADEPKDRKAPPPPIAGHQFAETDPAVWDRILGPSLRAGRSELPWEIVTLADTRDNDVEAYMRVRGDAFHEQMPILLEDGRRLVVNLLGSADGHTSGSALMTHPHPAEHTYRNSQKHNPEGYGELPRTRRTAVLESGIAMEIAPGRTIRARIDQKGGNPPMFVEFMDDGPVDLGLPISNDPLTLMPRILAIGPLEIMAHPHEMLVAQRLGLDPKLAARRARDTTSWPMHTDRRNAMNTGFRLDPTFHPVTGSETVRLTLEHRIDDTLAAFDGQLVIRGATIPDSVALHAVGRPLSDIARIESLADLPLVIHAIDAHPTGLTIDYCPSAECVSIRSDG